jgi:UDP-N-acetylglucosamine--N-acetylmuramyl-(pentapeptide) pyrophosphoryl-undecaprenol N-acetylglucosamine transferase
VVIGTGGFASGPLLKWPAWWYSYRNQEQNSYPGITNKLLSKKADNLRGVWKFRAVFPKEKMILTRIGASGFNWHWK